MSSMTHQQRRIGATSQGGAPLLPRNTMKERKRVLRAGVCTRSASSRAVPTRRARGENAATMRASCNVCQHYILLQVDDFGSVRSEQTDPTTRKKAFCIARCGAGCSLHLRLHCPWSLTGRRGMPRRVPQYRPFWTHRPFGKWHISTPLRNTGSRCLPSPG